MVIAVGVFVAIIVGLWYVIHCAFRPYADCRKCDGDPKFRSASGRSWRLCKKCGGSGSRVRFGRRVWIALVKFKKNAVD